MKKVIFLFGLGLASIVYAETKIEVYKIPLGEALKITNEDDIQRTLKKISYKKPDMKFVDDEHGKMLKFKNMKIFFKDPKNKKQNYNDLIELVGEFSEKIDSVDSSIVKRTLKHLKAE